MVNRERVYLHECCVVPYRQTALGIEFCLVSQVVGNRWEFPKAETSGDGNLRHSLLDVAATNAGLRGQLDGDDPLDEFVAARGDEARRMTAYLMQVTSVDEHWPNQSTHRRLWCLAEEARVRLRRKPLRRFIDIALRTIGPRPSNGNASGSGALPRKPR